MDYEGEQGKASITLQPLRLKTLAHVMLVPRISTPLSLLGRERMRSGKRHSGDVGMTRYAWIVRLGRHGTSKKNAGRLDSY